MSPSLYLVFLQNAKLKNLVQKSSSNGREGRLCHLNRGHPLDFPSGGIDAMSVSKLARSLNAIYKGHVKLVVHSRVIINKNGSAF